eukprot:10025833-Lingulodinium_polyedra.AAC.1
MAAIRRDGPCIGERFAMPELLPPDRRLSLRQILCAPGQDDDRRRRPRAPAAAANVDKVAIKAEQWGWTGDWA